jgi:hypothetical protein
MTHNKQNAVRYWETSPPRPGIFLCYRWVDTMAGVAIDNLLIPAYGEENIFRADRSLRPGEPFKQPLNEAVERASAMIAIVGLGWAQSLRDGKHEWALYEILQAQEHDVPVLPVYLTRTHYGHEETGSDEWQPIERPLETLTGEDLPMGVDPAFLDAEYLTFGTSHPREEGRRIVQALGRLVPTLCTETD